MQIHSLLHLMPVMADTITIPYKCIKPECITYQEMQVLMLIKEKPQIRMVDLADFLHIKKQQLTPLAMDLDQKGFLIRTGDIIDRRSVCVSLSKSGIKLLEEIDGNIVASLHPSFSSLTKAQQKRAAELASELADLLEHMKQ